MSAPSASFWRGRRVLVTGHTGFKGAWLWQLLRALGAQPIGLALAPATTPNLAQLVGIAQGAASHQLDIRDAERLAQAMRAAEPEIVLHLAAEAILRRSYARPIDTFATNVMGTLNVLEAARALPAVRAIVVATTDKVYRDGDVGRPYREGDELGGHDPYSASKACAEIAVASWRLSFLAAAKVGLATARAGNVIGGGDWGVDRLLPDLVRAFAVGDAAEIRRPDAIRPWIHVLEPLVGYLAVAQRLVEAPGEFSEAWNFGPYERDAPTVAAVAQRAAALWGGGRWQAAAGPHPHETATLRLDAAKAERRLGWRARLGFDEALAWTIDWYRRWHDGADAAALCQEQIEAYLARAGGA
jgi:CDP-glucose 4,6-dehydratase